MFKHYAGLALVVALCGGCTQETPSAGGGQAQDGAANANAVADDAALSEIEAWAQARFTTADDGGYLSSSKILTGDFTGDNKDDALAFFMHSCAQCGNSERIFVALFRNENGHFRFYREAPGVFGADPRQATFSTGSISVTTTMPKPDDPRCCPSGQQRWTIPTT
jgi:hypothetical protein